ncbi:hypothetical protein VRRI112168_02660 [Vreelandella rituensis]|uniref:Uncharacterized protein n=1 Tax=Vreelandella rituensis TaxID=2282306 RepID=A0A368UAK7_9GAMM|nr:hypothetical protein [Halomonas rituensis]RCV93646.1 hypothetical protein DU506_00380 [Halomonas rituensis]
MSSDITIQPVKQGDDTTGFAIVQNGHILRELAFSLDLNEINDIAVEVAGCELSLEQGFELEIMVHDETVRVSHQVAKRLEGLPAGTVAVFDECGLVGWVTSHHPGKLLVTPVPAESIDSASDPEQLGAMTPEDFDGNAHDVVNEVLVVFRGWRDAETPKTHLVNPERITFPLAYPTE